MKTGVSVYLDLIRGIAAIEVFLAHFGYPKFGDTLQILKPYAHLAVIAFFVISGYVIAYVSSKKESDIVSYSISRATRIYSVAIPALIITAGIDIFLQTEGIMHVSYQFAQPWKYIPLFLVFGTDWWFLSEDAFSNAPYWSLSYEVWYYALFAAYLYFTGQKRFLLCGAILLLVGPRSWLLLPVWLSGVWLYHFHANSTWPSSDATKARAIWGVTLVALIIVLVTKFYEVPSDVLYMIIGENIRHWLRYSQYFLGDYLVAFLIVMNIAVIPGCRFHFGVFERPIRYMAMMSFSLYLFHYPLLEFFSQWFRSLPLAIAVIVSVWGLTVKTEWFRMTMRSRAVAIFKLPRVKVRHS